MQDRSRPQQNIPTEVINLDDFQLEEGSSQNQRGTDLESISNAFSEIAHSFHEQTRELEQSVEGTFANDAADPRVKMLSKTLILARNADLRLAQLGQSLKKIAPPLPTLPGSNEDHKQLTTLYSVAQELNSSLEMDEVLGRVMDQMIEVVNAERGFVMLWNQDVRQLDLAVARQMDQRDIDKDGLSVSHGIINKVWESQKPLMTTNAQEDERLRMNQSVVAYGIRSVLCAPLRVRNHGIGVIYVDSRIAANLFTPDDLDLLSACCNQAAIAIENAKLFSDVKQKVREITEMKNYMENIFSSIASAVITIDNQGAIITFNRAAERIFQVNETTAKNEYLTSILPSPFDQELLKLVGRASLQREAIVGQVVECDFPQRGFTTLNISVSTLQDDNGQHLGMAMVIDDLTELRRSQMQAENIKGIFGRYVHPAVVDQLVNNPNALTLGGETREISVVFADIRGYTKISESMEPEKLVLILNEYLDILTEAIWEEKGTLTMFIGDALMAIFNAPLSQEDHALRAVRAAWRMRSAIEKYHEQNNISDPIVSYGIGVNTGFAVVGNIGSYERLQNYTAIGDAVNVASRLQSNSISNQILLNDSTYQLVKGQIIAEELEPLSVKNKSLPLTVYALQGLKENP